MAGRGATPTAPPVTSRRVAAGANVIDFASDAEGRLASTGRAVADVAAGFRYDGRSFLTQAQETIGDPPTEAASVQSSYDSSGLLHGLRRKADPADPEELVLHLYLAGRPVAQLAIDGIGAETWTYLTTDHLGTPLLATNHAGAVTWEGGLEPFGRDYQAGTADGMLESGIYLRLPGQWDDDSWSDVTSGSPIYYNVHRFYDPNTALYTRPDPFNLGRLLNADPPAELDSLGARLLAIGRAGNPKFESEYGYGGNQPLLAVDPDGRALPLVCAAPWVLPALGKAVAVTITVVSATAAGIAVADWWNDRKDCDECEEKDPPGPCDKLLDLCLINPWQPDWNKQIYGPRKDCGACYRSCKNSNGVWPFDKCPLP